MTQSERTEQVLAALEVFKAIAAKTLTAAQGMELLRQLGLTAKLEEVK